MYATSFSHRKVQKGQTYAHKTSLHQKAIETPNNVEVRVKNGWEYCSASVVQLKLSVIVVAYAYCSVCLQ